MTILFHEIYGKYTRILSDMMQSKTHTEVSIRERLEQDGYGETAFCLLPYLVSEDENWHLLKKKNGDYHRILKHPPIQPTTLMEKRWLKSMLEDPRIHNFVAPDFVQTQLEKLAGIEPLFSADMIDYFDRFQGGDPYDSLLYNEHARQLLQAIKTKELARVTYQSIDHAAVTHTIVADKLEYSPKNDKFRLKAKRETRTGNWASVVLNLSEIHGVELLGIIDGQQKAVKIKEKHIICQLRDDRDALERAMCHFSNYRKVTKRTTKEQEYHVTIYYPAQNETELLITVLSFGPFLKVLEPASFVRQLQSRLRRQAHLCSGISTKAEAGD